MSGDYTLEDNVYLLFTTRAFATGIPGVLSAATIAVYEDVTATPILTSVAVTETLNSINGLNAATIAATAANGFNLRGTYHAVIEAGTVDSVSVVGEVIGHFTLGHNAAAVQIGAAGAGLGDLGGMSTAMKAEAKTEADGALTDYDGPTKAEMDSAVSPLATTAELNKVPKSEGSVSWNSTALASINAQADTALSDYDPPTNTEMVAAFTEIKGASWATTDSLEAIRDHASTIKAETVLIVADTNELQSDDVPGLIATLDAVVDTVKAETALIVADTSELQGDDVPGLIATLDAVVDTVKAETALIVADTNELQTDNVPGLIATLDAVVDTVKAETVLILADTADIQPNYATEAKQDTLDAVADQLNLGIIYGAAEAGTLSTTVATSGLTGFADDQLNGRVIIFTSGPCEGEATDITDYASAGGTLTFTALTTAPGNGDTFKIV
jgi:uncharacterized protein YoxC